MHCALLCKLGTCDEVCNLTPLEDPGEPYDFPIVSPTSTGLLSFQLVRLSTGLEFAKHWQAHWHAVQHCHTLQLLASLGGCQLKLGSLNCGWTLTLD